MTHQQQQPKVPPRNTALCWTAGLQERQKLSSLEQRLLGVALASSLKPYSKCLHHHCVLLRMAHTHIVTVKLVSWLVYLLPALPIMGYFTFCLHTLTQPGLAEHLWIKFFAKLH